MHTLNPATIATPKPDLISNYELTQWKKFVKLHKANNLAASWNRVIFSLSPFSSNFTQSVNTFNTQNPQNPIILLQSSRAALFEIHDLLCLRMSLNPVNNDTEGLLDFKDVK